MEEVRFWERSPNLLVCIVISKSHIWKPFLTLSITGITKKNGEKNEGKKRKTLVVYV